MDSEYEDEFFNIEVLLSEEQMYWDQDNSDAENEDPNQQQQNQTSEAGASQSTELHGHVLGQPKGRKQLTVIIKRHMIDSMLHAMVDKEFPRGYLTKEARKYSVHKSTVQRLFKDLLQQLATGNGIDVRSKKLGKTGPKPTEYSDELLQSIPLYKRQTVRSYAAALKISHGTLQNLKKKGRLRTHTSSNHPALTSNHKIARIKWVLSHILPATVQGGNGKYMDMQNVVHIDEKWFFLNPETRRFYLLPNEEDPYRCQQSRRFKVKGMFMAIIGKPIFSTDGSVVHDGKYGIFEFAYQYTAKKKSKNRDAGAVEIKAIQNVNKEEIRKMLVNNIIPALKSQWPSCLTKVINIQWDNARPHQIPKDEEFIGICNSDGFTINIIYQPAQSPDMNVLDLGLFRVIQAIQYQSFPKNLEELIEKVKDAYSVFNPILNKYTWITLQQCMTEILKVQGGNNYKVPHMGKKRLDTMGLLPEILEVDKDLVQQAVDYLNLLFISPDHVGQHDVAMEVDAD